MDFSLPASENFRYDRSEIKKCDRNDFKNDQEYSAFLKEQHYAKYSICPDFNGTKIIFGNDTGETRSVHYSLNIKPCLDADDNHNSVNGIQCASREETKEYLKEVGLMVHTYENKIDFFQDRESEPFFTKWRRLDFSILEMEKTWWKAFGLEKNII